MIANDIKHIYFASDFHLGAPNYAESLKREKKVVRWLQHIQDHVDVLYLVGDIWDFWFEYKRAVPKGYTRLLGKLAELSDAGVEIHFFTGNHDMWTFGYLEKELGIQVHREPIEVSYFGKNYQIGHGDGLGPGDKKYKFLKRFFASGFCQWLLGRTHPNFSLGIGEYFSTKSRIVNTNADKIYLGEDEWLFQYCKEEVRSKPIDYFIFGHRHLPLELDIEGKATYFNLGEWINYCSYLHIENGKEPKLKFFESAYDKALNLN
ncbi:MAG: UDP-2,3-diacylglucosamine diphosphatase [Flavobacteriales bacterium]